MTENLDLLAEAEAWGIATSYYDWAGGLVHAPIETVEGLVTTFRRNGRTAPDTIVSGLRDPGRCAPPAKRAWGWALQLYSLRSQDTWGMGDLGCLSQFGRWAKDEGAGFVMVNPLLAALPTERQEPSPYYPSSRCFLSPLYLSMKGVPGAEDVVAPIADVASALNSTKLIERDRIFALKMKALAAIWQSFDGDRRFEAFRAQRGELLENYCLFAAMTEVHGSSWPEWPEDIRHPSAVGIERTRAELSERVSFHAWVQWLLDEQLEDAAKQIDLVQDVAVGVDPRGADAWMWQDSFLPGFTVGAPRDEFNAAGQNWAQPVFDPWALRSNDYAPFIQTIRSTLRHATGLRIDHVMGLFRIFVIPHGADPSQGTYIRYPHADLLALLATESQRAGAFVIGEDLGTVQKQVREELHRRGILTYRLMFFDGSETKDYPEQSFAAVTTHDLPTIAGLLSGADAEEKRRIGIEVNLEGTERMRSSMNDCVPPATADGIVAIHERLSGAGSVLVSATLEDALGVEQRPNMPGTTDEWPNWRIPLPVPLEQIARSERVHDVARAMGGAGRDGP